MPETPVRDIAALGAFRIKSSPAAGPADRFASSILINDDGVVAEQSNRDTPVSRVYGDGRKYMPIQLATPANHAPGQYWLEKVGTDVFFAFVDDGNNVIYVANSPAIVTGVALVDAVPVDVDSTMVGTGWKWIINFIDSNSNHVLVEVLAALIVFPAENATFTIYPATENFPHTIQVNRSAGTTTLSITASGVGYSVDVQRFTIP